MKVWKMMSFFNGWFSGSMLIFQIFPGCRYKTSYPTIYLPFRMIWTMAMNHTWLGMAVFLIWWIQVQGKPQGKGHHFFPWNSSSFPRIEVHVVFPHCCWFKKKIHLFLSQMWLVCASFWKKTVLHKNCWLGGGFKHFLFAPLFGEGFQFD